MLFMSHKARCKIMLYKALKIPLQVTLYLYSGGLLRKNACRKHSIKVHIKWSSNDLPKAWMTVFIGPVASIICLLASIATLIVDSFWYTPCSTK